MKVRSGKGRPKTPDDYLAALTADKRAALQDLRKDIKGAAPKAEECISYGVPGFRLNGKLLVSYGVGIKHCAFYPGSIVQAFKAELKKFYYEFDHELHVGSLSRRKSVPTLIERGSLVTILQKTNLLLFDHVLNLRDPDHRLVVEMNHDPNLVPVATYQSRAPEA